MADEEPTIRVTTSEVLAILAGGAMRFTAEPGGELVWVRLATPEELVEAHEASAAKFKLEPHLTLAQARTATMPIDVHAMVARWRGGRP